MGSFGLTTRSKTRRGRKLGLHVQERQLRAITAKLS
jgi:hypothetical protein